MLCIFPIVYSFFSFCEPQNASIANRIPRERHKGLFLQRKYWAAEYGTNNFIAEFGCFTFFFFSENTSLFRRFNF